MGRRLIASVAGLVLVAATIAVTAAALTAVPVLACSCAAASPQSAQPVRLPPDVQVFTGTVTSIDDPQGGGGIVSSDRPLLVHFAVETIYQGSITQGQVVSTAASSASCGFPFVVGQRYTVFIDPGSTSIGLCGGAVSGSINPAAYGLGAGSNLPPPPTGIGSAPRWAAIAVVAGAGVLGFVALTTRARRRRSPEL